MQSCLDCLNCKIKPKDKYLHCSAKQWLNLWGSPKTITLSKTECVTGHINHRDLFNHASICSSMIPMD